MIDQTNYLGAIVFWLYIIAALTFTFLVIDSIIRLPSPISSKHVATFTVLAFLSFSTLSFNMLHVLFNSYNTWLDRIIPAPPLSPSSIWTWSINNRQFRDFGEAIVANEARYLWTQSSLLATLSVSFFMSFEGAVNSSLHVRKIAFADLFFDKGMRSRIPRLWAYFALAQVLPISFAQNLFYIALLRSKHDQRSNAAVSGSHTIPLVLFYCIILSVAPLTARTAGLMPVIALARVSLALPLAFTGRAGGIVSNWIFNGTGLLDHWEAQTVVWLCAAVMTMKQFSSAVKDGHSVGGLYHALYSDHAVTTLGLDFLITMSSFVIWVAFARGKERSKTQSEKSF